MPTDTPMTMAFRPPSLIPVCLSSSVIHLLCTPHSFVNFLCDNHNFSDNLPDIVSDCTTCLHNAPLTSSPESPVLSILPTLISRKTGTVDVHTAPLKGTPHEPKHRNTSASYHCNSENVDECLCFFRDARSRLAMV